MIVISMPTRAVASGFIAKGYGTIKPRGGHALTARLISQELSGKKCCSCRAILWGNNT